MYLLCLTAAEQSYRVLVCGCAQFGSLEATVHQISLSVEVSLSVIQSYRPIAHF